MVLSGSPLLIATHVFLYEGYLRLMCTAMEVDKRQLTGKEKNRMNRNSSFSENIFRKC